MLGWVLALPMTSCLVPAHQELKVTCHACPREPREGHGPLAALSAAANLPADTRDVPSSWRMAAVPSTVLFWDLPSPLPCLCSLTLCSFYVLVIYMKPAAPRGYFSHFLQQVPAIVGLALCDSPTTLPPTLPPSWEKPPPASFPFLTEAS